MCAAQPRSLPSKPTLPACPPACRPGNAYVELGFNVASIQEGEAAGPLAGLQPDAAAAAAAAKTQQRQHGQGGGGGGGGGGNTAGQGGGFGSDSSNSMGGFLSGDTAISDGLEGTVSIQASPQLQASSSNCCSLLASWWFGRATWQISACLWERRAVQYSSSTIRRSP